MAAREENERKFGYWNESKDGRRTYWYEVKGKYGWVARYVKVVDENEDTILFKQEIYNDKNELVEVHQKFPIDTGHQKLHKN